MFYLETPRLLLVQTPQDIVQTRLAHPGDFSAAVALPGGGAQLAFPTEWPGDALVLFPIMLAQYERDPARMPWGGTLIDRAALVAVGQMGCKSLPTEGGVEIGYGVSPAYQGRGYATEMVRALVPWALAQPGVRRVTAECRTDNAGSRRVLEKAGFALVGRRVDIEDGPLLLWERGEGSPGSPGNAQRLE